MRTTVEITNEQRARLLEMAALRGEKGFSRLVQEALREYLARDREREAACEEALRQRGAINDEDSEALRRATASLRAEGR